MEVELERGEDEGHQDPQHPDQAARGRGEWGHWGYFGVNLFL